MLGETGAGLCLKERKESQNYPAQKMGGIQRRNFTHLPLNSTAAGESELDPEAQEGFLEAEDPVTEAVGSADAELHTRRQGEEVLLQKQLRPD